MDVGSRVMQDDSMDGGGRECLEHIFEQLPSSGSLPPCGVCTNTAGQDDMHGCINAAMTWSQGAACPLYYLIH